MWVCQIYNIVVLCGRWTVGVLFIYRFERVGVSGSTVDVDGCGSCVFCRLACGGVRGGLYFVVRAYVGGLSGVIVFVFYMCGRELLGVMVCQVGLLV